MCQSEISIYSVFDPRDQEIYWNIKPVYEKNFRENTAYKIKNESETDLKDFIVSVLETALAPVIFPNPEEFISEMLMLEILIHTIYKKILHWQFL